jgi:predicted glycosyltransferase
MNVSALVYVQHLLGIGHLARIGRIAHHLAAAGVRTTLVQGGTPAEMTPAAGVDTVQLAPVRVTSQDMSTLLHADGAAFTDAHKAMRRDHLLATLDAVRPDILIVEAYPFGRRQMRFELLPLITAARRIGTRIIACSIRDLLQENRRLDRAEETVRIVNRHFDMVLVHGDEELTPLSMTFPLVGQLIPPVRYTGLVGPPPSPVRSGHDVVVSAGGGVVGARLLEAAIGARAQSIFATSRWLVLAGPNLPESDFGRLQSLAAEHGDGVTLLRSVPDLPAHLAAARLSISQAGYNTVADILASGCAAVLSPFAAGGETEQTMRAEALGAARRAAVVHEGDLSPRSVATAMAEAMALPKAAPMMLEGGARTAAILLEALERSKTRDSCIDPTFPALSDRIRGRT